MKNFGHQWHISISKSLSSRAGKRFKCIKQCFFGTVEHGFSIKFFCFLSSFSNELRQPAKTWLEWLIFKIKSNFPQLVVHHNAFPSLEIITGNRNVFCLSCFQHRPLHLSYFVSGKLPIELCIIVQY